MHIKVYDGEKFERGKLWYIIFAVVFASIFVLSILNQNRVWAVLMFFLLGAYFYYSVTGNQVVKATINDSNLSIWTKILPRNSLQWYAIELDSKSETIKNIVFVTKNSHNIHTIHDGKENVRSFVLELDNYIPMLGEYNQSFLEKMARKCEL